MRARYLLLLIFWPIASGAVECGEELKEKIERFVVLPDDDKDEFSYDFTRTKVTRENSLAVCQYRNNNNIHVGVIKLNVDGRFFLVVTDEAFGATRFYGPMNWLDSEFKS